MDKVVCPRLAAGRCDEVKPENGRPERRLVLEVIPSLTVEWVRCLQVLHSRATVCGGGGGGAGP